MSDQPQEDQEVTSRKACISYVFYKIQINNLPHIFMISVVFLLYVEFALHKCDRITSIQPVEESREG